MITDRKNILISGGSGYLGNIITATLLSRTPHHLLLLLRPKHRLESIMQNIQAHLDQDPLLKERRIDPERISILPLPPLEKFHEIIPAIEKQDVQEIIHCAGSLRYFDKPCLTEANIDYTQKLIDLGAHLNLERFFYISTAFSSGFTDQMILEKLPPEPLSDPTEYTRTKRMAETLLANSGLPFMIVRPSIVIGDSRTGVYGGKPYGIYQVMRASETFLTDQYHPVMHLLAPKKPLPLLHQNAFQEGFYSYYQHGDTGTFFNLVSEEEILPSARNIWEFYVELCFHPQEVYYYNHGRELPLDKMGLRQKTVMEFSAVNFEIAAHPWHFQRDLWHSLEEKEFPIISTTVETLNVCLLHFFQNSQRLREFPSKFSSQFPPTPKVAEISSKNLGTRLG